MRSGLSQLLNPYMSHIQIFSARFRPSVSRPPVEILCQAVDVGSEKLLWVDGLMFDHPILIPISAATGLVYKATFRELMEANLDRAKAVLDASKGLHSPTVLVRAVAYMHRDPSLSADDAIDLVTEEALDLIDADSRDRIAADEAERALA